MSSHRGCARWRRLAGARDSVVARVASPRKAAGSVARVISAGARGPAGSLATRVFSCMWRERFWTWNEPEGPSGHCSSRSVQRGQATRLGAGAAAGARSRLPARAPAPPHARTCARVHVATVLGTAPGERACPRATEEHGFLTGQRGD